MHIMKPIIGCCTCMASVWVIVIDYFYFNSLNKWTVLIIFVVACLNSLFYATFELIKEYKS